MPRHPVIELIDQADPPRALDRRRLRRLDMAAVALLLPNIAIVGTGFVFNIWFGWSQLSIDVIFLGLFYFIAWTLFEVFLGVIFPARCHLVWLRDRIERRNDAVVIADDPNALFLKIIPRKNWAFEKAAACTDVGLLAIDPTRRELRYEGDRERWVFPAEAIRSFAVHSITHEGKLLTPLGFSVVLLWIELSDGVLREIALACQPTHIEFWTPRRKRERCRILASAIGHLVDPERWPAVEAKQLRPLRAPPRLPEVRDFG